MEPALIALRRPSAIPLSDRFSTSSVHQCPLPPHHHHPHGQLQLPHVRPPPPLHQTMRLFLSMVVLNTTTTKTTADIQRSQRVAEEPVPFDGPGASAGGEGPEERPSPARAKRDRVLRGGGGGGGAGGGGACGGEVYPGGGQSRSVDRRSARSNSREKLEGGRVKRDVTVVGGGGGGGDDDDVFCGFCQVWCLGAVVVLRSAGLWWFRCAVATNERVNVGGAGLSVSKKAGEGACGSLPGLLCCPLDFWPP